MGMPDGLVAPAPGLLLQQLPALDGGLLQGSRQTISHRVYFPYLSKWARRVKHWPGRGKLFFGGRDWRLEVVYILLAFFFRGVRVGTRVDRGSF